MNNTKREMFAARDDNGDLGLYYLQPVGADNDSTKWVPRPIDTHPRTDIPDSFPGFGFLPAGDCSKVEISVTELLNDKQLASGED